MAVRRPTEDELKKLNQFYTKKELSANDLWVLDVEGAHTGVQTAYYSYLTDRSIENFVVDVNAKLVNKKGRTIGYYLNHDKFSRLPLGGLFDAEKVDGEDNESTFSHKVYMRSGYSTGDITTDDYVDAVDSGIIEDVSVGFIANKTICRLCKEDIRSMKCPHWPGMRYNVGTEKEPRFEICTYDVDGAKLQEESAAWKGALPGAKVLSEDGDNPHPPANIKAFPEGAWLKFNCSYDGSIELAEDIEFMKEGKNKEEPGIEVPEEGKQELTQPEGGNDPVDNKPTEPGGVILPEAYVELKNENDQLKETVASLESQLAEAKQKSDEYKEIADRFVADIKKEVHKLAVGIDAEGYNEERENMWISKMSLDELIIYRDQLKNRLSKSIKTGRFTKGEEAGQSADLVSYIDTKVFSTRR